MIKECFRKTDLEEMCKMYKKKRLLKETLVIAEIPMSGGTD